MLIVVLRFGCAAKPVNNSHPWDPKKWLFKKGLLLTGFCYKLLSILENWGSGWPLLIGGHCSEVVVNTGLTVLKLLQQ
jgi:hypothetical protein